MSSLIWMIAAGLGAAVSEPVTVKVASDGSRVELLAASPEADPRLLVRPVDGPPLLGRVESRPDRLVFRPALPFLPGRRYLAEWREGSSGLRQAEFRWDSPKRRPPQVELRPQGSLPANALKLYLHFSAPMEQGVFLDRLRLLDAAGHEITGPFRETELWSPDGKRLTLWFHPGRQKTGVNLNLDEGPVLPEGQTGTLVVSGHWRDTAGAALGHDVRLKWEVISADHSPPAMERWTILPPPAGSSEALSVRFDEPLDPAMLESALTVVREGTALRLRIEVEATGCEWKALPETPWSPGPYELHADPLLEDLAGNSLVRPFEVDVSQGAADPLVPTLTSRTFEIR